MGPEYKGGVLGGDKILAVQYNNPNPNPSRTDNRICVSAPCTDNSFFEKYRLVGIRSVDHFSYHRPFVLCLIHKCACKVTQRKNLVQIAGIAVSYIVPVSPMTYFNGFSHFCLVILTVLV